MRALAVDGSRLAWGVTASGEVLVATPTSLYAGSEQLAWTSIEKVVWRPPVLTVAEVALVEGTGRSRSFELAEDSRLAETIRACVTTSVAWSARRALVPSGAVRLVGRRVPGRETLLWQTVWEQGSDHADPRVRQQAERWVDELSKTIG